jgi:hypothetical protein
VAQEIWLEQACEARLKCLLQLKEKDDKIFTKVNIGTVVSLPHLTVLRVISDISREPTAFIF